MLPGDLAHLTGFALYFAIFALPFIQEDAAVIGAATASMLGLAPTTFLVAAILSGLVFSDGWKYWIGRLARRYEWAHKFAEKPGVSVAGDLVRKEFVQTMLTARFVPGTRIPTYVACGFFKAHYGKYLAVLLMTASLYVAIMFTLFHVGGAVAGEAAKFWLPAIAVTVLAIYVAVRWQTHRRGQHGPMTPLTEERDHPLPGMPGFDGTPLEGHENGNRESGFGNRGAEPSPQGPIPESRFQIPEKDGAA
jgi:membrane protein DedA with SNARE-associated domain